MKKKLKLIGEITSGYKDSFDVILLKQEDGYLVSISSRLEELMLNTPKSVQVNYHISDTNLTEEGFVEANIISISGGINVEFERYEYQYSSWTSGTDYNTIMKIGNHDLYHELRYKCGKFLFLEVNYEL